MFKLRLGYGTNIQRTDRCAKDLLAIFWIGNPANSRCIEDGVPPSSDIEREFIHVDVSSSSFETPVVILVEVDAVEENGDLGGSDKRALKFDAHRGRVIGIHPEVVHVFTSEEIQITGCEGEHMDKGDVTVTRRCITSGDLAVSRTLCDVLEP